MKNLILLALVLLASTLAPPKPTVRARPPSSPPATPLREQNGQAMRQQDDRAGTE